MTGATQSYQTDEPCEERSSPGSTVAPLFEPSSEPDTPDDVDRIGEVVVRRWLDGDECGIDAVRRRACGHLDSCGAVERGRVVVEVVSEVPAVEAHAVLTGRQTAHVVGAVEPGVGGTGPGPPSA